MTRKKNSLIFDGDDESSILRARARALRIPSSRLFFVGGDLTNDSEESQDYWLDALQLLKGQKRVTNGAAGEIDWPSLNIDKKIPKKNAYVRIVTGVENARARTVTVSMRGVESPDQFAKAITDRVRGLFVRDSSIELRIEYISSQRPRGRKLKRPKSPKPTKQDDKLYRHLAPGSGARRGGNSLSARHRRVASQPRGPGGRFVAR